MIWMNRGVFVKRRVFTSRVLFLISGALIVRTAPAHAVPLMQVETKGNVITFPFKNRRALRKLYRAYLKASTPNDRKLTSHKMLELKQNEKISAKEIKDQVREDYTSGNICYVGNWILSRTEIALSALA